MHFVSKPVKMLAVNTQKNSKYCPKSVEEKALKKTYQNQFSKWFERLTASASSVHLNHPAS